MCDPQLAARDAATWVNRLVDEGYFEWHLWPQSLYLSRPDGSPHPGIDYICSVEELQKGYDELARRRPGFQLVATKGRNTYLQVLTDFVANSQFVNLSEFVLWFCRISFGS